MTKSEINRESKAVYLYADEPELGASLLSEVDLEDYSVAVSHTQESPATASMFGLDYDPLQKRRTEEGADLSWLAKFPIKTLSYCFTDFDTLYDIPTLQTLYLPHFTRDIAWKTKKILDFSRSRRLKILYTNWNKCMVNLGACPSLEELHIWHYEAGDFSNLGRCASLREI